ncbi:uncharacterized protein LOC131948930 [Physella acuta]|uniref:uncharacterized protein LOC131948930 n=1 Tax=Physella acuta TaxID=109671 RepID=UPI0027DD2054|nr:uncharacterized protein LOC131948930 [Physella acuta]
MKSKQEEHLSEEETARFAHQILEGLEYLHEKRVIHRDIKASNILMVDDQNIKIADFGVAKILNTLSSATTNGVGTVNWMAPELFLPESWMYSLSDADWNYPICRDDKCNNNWQRHRKKTRVIRSSQLATRLQTLLASCL